MDLLSYFKNNLKLYNSKKMNNIKLNSMTLGFFTDNINDPNHYYFGVLAYFDKNKNKFISYFCKRAYNYFYLIDVPLNKGISIKNNEIKFNRFDDMDKLLKRSNYLAIIKPLINNNEWYKIYDLDTNWCNLISHLKGSEVEIIYNNDLNYGLKNNSIIKGKLCGFYYCQDMGIIIKTKNGITPYTGYIKFKKLKTGISYDPFVGLWVSGAWGMSFATAFNNIYI